MTKWRKMIKKKNSVFIIFLTFLLLCTGVAVIMHLYVLGHHVTLVLCNRYHMTVSAVWLICTEPEGCSPKGDGYISCTARDWHAICIIYPMPKGGGTCALHAR